MAQTFHPLMAMDSTLGAVFIGGIVAGIFYGITCVQSYIYFTNYQKDPKWLKIAILVLWITDTFHLALIVHGLYYYTISNFGNYFTLQSTPVWSFIVQVCISVSFHASVLRLEHVESLIVLALQNVSDLIVRWIFGRRVWLLSGRNHFLVVCIALISLLGFASSFAFAAYTFIGVIPNFSTISAMLYIGLSCGIAADTLIATFLCINLWRQRTSFQKSKSLVKTLMIYTINTALLTTICYTACLISYAVGTWPNDFEFMAIFFPLSSLFANSLLASLNSREGLFEKNNGFKHLSIPSGVLNTHPQSTV